MNPLIACCGLDCEKCQARIATVNDDDALRAKVVREWSELNHVTITPEMINCLGCRVEGPKTPFCESLCPIRLCVRAKSYETCAPCPDLRTCSKLAMITSTNSDALARLEAAENP